MKISADSAANTNVCTSESGRRNFRLNAACEKITNTSSAIPTPSSRSRRRRERVGAGVFIRSHTDSSAEGTQKPSPDAEKLESLRYIAEWPTSASGFSTQLWRSYPWIPCRTDLRRRARQMIPEALHRLL